MSDIETDYNPRPSADCELFGVIDQQTKKLIGDAFIYRRPRLRSIEAWCETFRIFVASENPPTVGVVASDQTITQILPARFSKANQSPESIRRDTIAAWAQKAAESEVVIIARPRAKPNSS